MTKAEAYTAGEAAGKAGIDVATCPYRPRRWPFDRTLRRLRRAWLDGWRWGDIHYRAIALAPQCSSCKRYG